MPARRVGPGFGEVPAVPGLRVRFSWVTPCRLPGSRLKEAPVNARFSVVGRVQPGNPDEVAGSPVFGWSSRLDRGPTRLMIY